jgi:capsular polysaccharide biosynthesis protein
VVLGRSFIPAAQTGHAFAEQCIHNPRKLQWDTAPRVFDTLCLASGSRILAGSSGTDAFPGRHVLIGNHENWGHWLLNHFSRLSHLEQEPGLRDAPVVVGDDIRPIHLECLSRAGIAPGQIVRLRQGRLASFGELWVPSMLYCAIGGYEGRGARLHWNAGAIGFMRRQLRLDFSAPAKRRIYIGRKDARWRRLLNEAEIVEVLRRFGFETVDPGAMSLDEQIELGASAQIIVGAFGAGLNLLLFAREGTPVVELKYNLNGLMDINWALTGALLQPHHEIFGESQPTDPDFLKRDFTVDADRVREVVGKALDALDAR